MVSMRAVYEDAREVVFGYEKSQKFSSTLV